MYQLIEHDEFHTIAAVHSNGGYYVITTIDASCYAESEGKLVEAPRPKVSVLPHKEDSNACKLET